VSGSERPSENELKTQAMGQTVRSDALPTMPGDQLAAGAMIGQYRIRRLLGEGGMGQVYLADQIEPIRREVALKLLASSRLSGTQVAWFEIERQVLAQMRHPGIAQVFDAGTTEDGSPYFAMEYIEGEPITDFCRIHGLDLRQRIELFIRVCQGVQHAHQKGIVHRDLKPGNILVATVDGAALPKIIDFGVATATHRALASGRAETRDRAGTPEYMSPEQSGVVEQDVDTRSDVYSLGVVLYELLTGHRPEIRSNTGDAPQSPATTLVPPSDRLGSLEPGAVEELAREQGLSATRLIGALRSELDHVVLKAVRFDRAERYASAAELGDDLRRFLEHRPLLAVPPSRRYELSRFLLRNRLAIAAASGIGLALVAGLALSLWFLMDAREQRRLAEARSAELGQVVAFQQRMLSDVDVEAMGSTLRQDLSRRHASALQGEGVGEEEAIEQDQAFERALGRAGTADAARGLLNSRVLAPALQGIEKDFADQPLLAAALRSSVAEVYFTLGLFADSVAHHAQALSEREGALGADHPLSIQSALHLGGALLRADRLEEASQVLQQVHERAERVLDADDDLRFAIRQQLAQSVSDAGRLEDARSMQEDLLQEATAQFGLDHARSLTILNNLAITQIKMGDYARARESFEQLVPRREAMLGPLHQDTLSSMSNLAALRGSTGDLEGAQELQQRLVDLLTERLGHEHPTTLSQANNLATTIYRMGRADEALQRMTEVAEARRRVQGENHAETLRSMHNLASVFNRVGQSQRSLEMMQEVLARRREKLGPDHPDTISTWANIPSVLRTLDRTGEALAMATEVLEARQRVLGPSHPDSLNGMEEIAKLQIDLDQLEQAQKTAAHALQIAIERHQDDAHADVRRAAITLFYVLKLRGQEQAAADILEKHLAALLAAPEADLGPAERGLRQRLERTLVDLEEGG